MKDEKCKVTEERIKNYMYENHRVLWNKFRFFMSFPTDYDSPVGAFIKHDVIKAEAEKFEQLLKECEAEIRKNTYPLNTSSGK